MKLPEQIYLYWDQNSFFVVVVIYYEMLKTNTSNELPALLSVRGYFQVTVIFKEVSSLSWWLRLASNVMGCAMVWVSVSSQNSYVEIPMLDVTVFVDGPLGGASIIGVDPSWMKLVPL